VTLRQHSGGSLVFSDSIVKVALHGSIVKLRGNGHMAGCTLGGIVRGRERGLEGNGLGRGLCVGLS
jgi:hypothetical protein